MNTDTVRPDVMKLYCTPQAAAGIIGSCIYIYINIIILLYRAIIIIIFIIN